MTLKTVSLNDKYDLGKTLVFLSGIQVLVRLMLMQKGARRGGWLNTAG
jgi:indolepyruvate ferredoxin oxidoreductase